MDKNKIQVWFDEIIAESQDDYCFDPVNILEEIRMANDLTAEESKDIVVATETVGFDPDSKEELYQWLLDGGYIL